MNRKKLYKLHSILGISTGVFLVIIGFSGSLLVFGKEIDQLLNPNRWYIFVDKERLSIDVLRAKLRQELPSHTLAGWLLPEKQNQPDQVWLHFLDSKDRKESVILLNPYTGKILGILSENRSDSFYGWMLKLHYSLLMGSFGYFLTTLFGAIFIFQGISGMILYRSIWQNLLRLRTKQSFRTFFSDLHKLVGVFSLVFNMSLGFTGAWWNVQAIVNLSFSQEERKVEKFFKESISMDSLLKELKMQLPEFQIGFVSFPHHHENDPIQFYGTEKPTNPFRSRFGSYVRFDSESGKLLEIFNLSNENLFYTIIDSFRPIHYGTFGGIITKILWVILGVSPGILYISGIGILISKRNLQEKRKN